MINPDHTFLPETPTSDALSRVLGISRMMVARTDLDQMLKLIMNEATRLTRADRSALFLLNDATNELISYLAKEEETREIRLLVGKGIAGQVALKGETINISDAYGSSLFDQTWDQRTGYRTDSVLAVPMRDSAGRTIGVAQVLNSESGKFEPSDEATLKIFAAHAAASIENVRLHEDMKLIFMSAIRALAEAIEKRDPGTAGHSERVTYYSIRLAQAMGMDPDQITMLEYAATLHDVGKIGVPDHILAKPSKLTDEEYEIIKTHASFSREILEKFYFAGIDRQVPFVAGAHHERLDGSGYPDGLTSIDLPLPVRILMVADVYDALTSCDRPYRKAFLPEEGLAILRKDAPRMFDDEVVRVFIEKGLYKIERRRFIRIDLESTMEYRILSRDRFSTEAKKAYTKDVSGQGMRFVVSDFIPMGSYMEVMLHVGNETCVLMAKVVRIDRVIETSDFSISIMFLNMTGKEEKALHRHLIEVSPTATH